MTLRPLFGLAALLPAALGTGPAAARSVLAPLCTGNGAAITVAIPLAPGGQAPGNRDAPCCAKGCHAGGSRKRGARHI